LGASPLKTGGASCGNSRRYYEKFMVLCPFAHGLPSGRWKTSRACKNVTSGRKPSRVVSDEKRTRGARRWPHPSSCTPQRDENAAGRPRLTPRVFFALENIKSGRGDRRPRLGRENGGPDRVRWSAQKGDSPGRGASSPARTDDVGCPCRPRLCFRIRAISFHFPAVQLDRGRPARGAVLGRATGPTRAAGPGHGPRRQAPPI
jgi:hypothetical protein